MAGPTVDLRLTSNDWIFEKLFHGKFIFTLRVFARNLLRGNRRRNIFCILIWRLAYATNPGFTSNKSTYYLLDYGDFHFHSTHIVCVNSVHEWFTVAEKLFMVFRAFDTNLREEVVVEIFLHISFWLKCLTWGLNYGLMSNKPTHHLLNKVCVCLPSYSQQVYGLLGFITICHNKL